MDKIYSVKVKFRGSSNEYCYRSFEELKVGDFVVVPTKDSMALAKVSAVDCKETCGKKFVILKVTTSDLARVISGIIEEYDADRFFGRNENLDAILEINE